MKVVYIHEWLKGNTNVSSYYKLIDKNYSLSGLILATLLRFSLGGADGSNLITSSGERLASGINNIII